MLRRTERILENIPVGSLGLISLTGCEELGKKVDDYLVKWRHESGNAFRDDIAFSGYEKDSYLLDARVPRFGSGEAKGVLGESVRGKDRSALVIIIILKSRGRFNAANNPATPVPTMTTST